MESWCSAYLDQILALWLCDQRLQLGRREGVDKTGFGHDEKQDLSTCQDRQFVCLELAWSVGNSGQVCCC